MGARNAIKKMVKKNPNNPAQTPQDNSRCCF